MIVYLETNFLLGLATGQDAGAAALLGTDAAKVTLHIPSVCVMEAWSALRAKRAELNRFRAEVAKLLREAQRDSGSGNAAALSATLQRAEIEVAGLFNDMEGRLQVGIRAIGVGHPSLIDLSPLALRTSISQRHIDAPADNLILHNICDHAAKQVGQDRLLCTANARDFDTPPVRNVLAAYGVPNYAKSCADALAWIKARGGS